MPQNVESTYWTSKSCTWATARWTISFFFNLIDLAAYNVLFQWITLNPDWHWTSLPMRELQRMQLVRRHVTETAVSVDPGMCSSSLQEHLITSVQWNEADIDVILLLIPTCRTEGNATRVAPCMYKQQNAISTFTKCPSCGCDVSVNRYRPRQRLITDSCCSWYGCGSAALAAAKMQFWTIRVLC